MKYDALASTKQWKKHFRWHKLVKFSGSIDMQIYSVADGWCHEVTLMWIPLLLALIAFIKTCMYTSLYKFKLYLPMLIHCCFCQVPQFLAFCLPRVLCAVFEVMRAAALFALFALAGAMELTKETWDDAVAGKTVFVKFLAPW